MTTPATRPDPAGPARLGWLAVALGVVAWTGLVWAARGELGMTWDEPYFFERQHEIGDWLGDVLAGDAPARARALTRAGMERSWRVARAVPDQHPPVPELLSLATGRTTSWLLGPLRSYRLATVLVFAAAAATLWRLLRDRWGDWAAAAGLGALLFNPRLFADAQQITADADTGAFWFLAAVAHLRYSETGRRPWAFGVFAGLAIMCKATGVLLFPAAIFWGLTFRPAGWWRPLAWSIPIVPAVMIAVMPPWWPDPVGGVVRWVGAFLAYPQKVPVLYLGQVYDSTRTFLPWHNTIVLTATMIPPGLLALAGVGLVAGWRRRAKSPPSERPGMLPDRAVVAWGAIHCGTWLVLRMGPWLPAHDGLRQLVPAFYFLPVLAAFGAGRLASGASRARRWAGRVAVAGCLGGAAWATVSFHPFELSYYNALIGGPAGARAAGMESTYFWDAATVDVLDWMNANLPPESTVLIFPPPNVLTFGWEQRWGRLRRDLRFVNLDEGPPGAKLALMDGPAPCYLIFQMRQGLYASGRPGRPGRFEVLAAGPARYEVAPPMVGVRLLGIFDQDDYRRAVAEVERGRSGRP